MEVPAPLNGPTPACRRRHDASSAIGPAAIHFFAPAGNVRIFNLYERELT